MNIELYINNQLADIGDPNKFSIQLKKVLISPSDLSTKKAQRSYNISLPATAANNAILGGRNTEEVRGKFAILFNAVLVANGIKLLDGKFRLNEITPQAYSGNLGVPAAKTTREIFGDTNLSDIGEWELDFGDFKESVEEINAEKTPKCIFPYVLYGLMPKSKKENGNYSEKDLYDETVVITPDDLPPSINCLEAVKQMFKAKNLIITGTAFNDARLNQLYMSYSNPTEYEMPWNYGLLGKIEIDVKWKNHKITDRQRKSGKQKRYVYEVLPDYSLERNTSPTYPDLDSVYIADLLNSPYSNVIIDKKNTNVLESKTRIKDKEPYTHYSVIIPHSGIYKIDLEDVKMKRVFNWHIDEIYWTKAGDTDIWVAGPNDYEGQNLFRYYRTEIKVVRDKREGSFDLSDMDIDRSYYRENMKQTNIFEVKTEYTDSENNKETNTAYNFPKYYPYSGNTAFIDPKVNSKLLCGLSFGGSKYEHKRYEDKKSENPYVNYYEQTKAAEINNDLLYCNPIAVKGGYSWDTEEEDFVIAATNCKGYIEYKLNYNNNTSEELTIEKVWNDKSKKYKVETQGLKKNSAKVVKDSQGGYSACEGEVHQLVWLEKGERITIVVCSEAARWYRKNGMPFMSVEAKLRITPYKMDKTWLEDQLDANGESLNPIEYNAKESDFVKDHINLMKFLPSNKKADEWLTQFCKAFNLNLYYNDEDRRYQLDIKQQKSRLLSNIIDLDNRTNVSVGRTNTPIGIPKEYKLGFTVSRDEEGYVSSDKFKDSTLTEEEKQNIPAQERYDTGGGIYKTGSIETKTIEQTSNFSYCWYKDIKVGDKTYKMPIISDKEVWKNDSRDYAKMMQKDYSNKPQRFWYRDGTITLSGLGGRSENKIKVATVTNELTDRMILDYKDSPNSIMNNYFAVFTNAENAFTTVESYLTPAEYAALDYSYVKLNGDLYLPAEIDAFDPSGRKPCKLKLIRKLV